jgi:Glycosyltransferase family 28 C-terminal domain
MIGYYVHHVGRGHQTRALAVAECCHDDVTGLGSLPRPRGWRGDWIELPRDDDPPVAADASRKDAWHWLPPAHDGFRDRMSIIAAWISAQRPRLLVSDVSVEVLVLGALMGVRTAAVVLHGCRDDPPHRLAFATADALIGPWPPSHLQHWHRDYAHRLRATGGFGPYDARGVATTVTGRVVVLVGAGPHDLDAADVIRAAAATPEWEWHVVGAADSGDPSVVWHGWLDDPWQIVSTAEVVVSTAGNGAVAQIAAAQRPAILMPQGRPFDEQLHLARCVGANSPARVIDAWPQQQEWPGLLNATAALDGTTWQEYADGQGAQRFADVLAQAAA